jgi:hypothetical protein
MNEGRNGKKCSEETATIGISEWVACCPSFSKKVVRTSRRREMFGLDTKLSRACPYLPVKNDFPVATLFPITIINAATVQRAFLVSVHVMHPAKQTCVSCLQGKGFLLLHRPTNCANSPTAPSVTEPVKFTELNLTHTSYFTHRSAHFRRFWHDQSTSDHFPCVQLNTCYSKLFYIKTYLCCRSVFVTHTHNLFWHDSKRILKTARFKFFYVPA